MRISDWSSDVCSSDLLSEVWRERTTPGAYESNGQIFSHSMASRRIRDVQISCHRNVPAIRKRMPFNYAYLNPEELNDLDLKAGDMIDIKSDAGTMHAAVKPDHTPRREVVPTTREWKSGGWGKRGAVRAARGWEGD